jgi:hypothetical protein
MSSRRVAPTRHRTIRTSITGLAIALALIGVVGSEIASAGLLIGAHVRTPSGISETDSIKRFEKKLGHRLPGVRLFYQWNDSFPNATALWARKTHHRVFMSFKARTSSNRYIKWRRIADSRPGTGIYRNLVDWAQGIKKYNAPVLFSFQPEPESWSGDPNGAPGDFKAAWRKIWHVFRSRGVRNAKFVWTMTGWAFRATDQRAETNWWPGAKYVDAIGADVYNWFTCRGEGDGWDSLASDVRAIRRFARKWPRKEIYLPEFGSVEDRSRPRRKAQWFKHIKRTFKRRRYRQFAGLFYFHARSTDDGVCDWRVDTSRRSLRAFRGLTGDHFYRSG